MGQAAAISLQDDRAEPRRRVLYAEDQASARIVTTALLQRLGYDVDAVEDGERAVECARANHYDLILLDIEMPVMDGVTAARIIRSEETLCKQSPIVALSAFLADSTETSHWREAFDGALPKPANSSEIRQVIGRMLDRPTNPVSPVPARIIEDLQAVLPAGAWRRLATQAAAEMHAMALTYAACRDGEDHANGNHALKVLGTLAANFGATSISLCVASTMDPQGGPDVNRLMSSIYEWKRRHTADC